MNGGISLGRSSQHFHSGLGLYIGTLYYYSVGRQTHTKLKEMFQSLLETYKRTTLHRKPTFLVVFTKANSS